MNDYSSDERSVFMHTEMREGVDVELVDLGPIADVSPASKKLWTGKISVNEIGPRRAEQALENVGEYYRECSANAAERCIDGRCIAHYGENHALHGRPIGPQTPAATPAITYSWRLMKANKLEDGRTFTDDLDVTLELCRKMNFYFGGHIDDHAKPPMTGCGAIDRLPEIVKKITGPKFAEAAAPYLEAVLGEDFSPDVMISLIERAKILEKKNGSYLEHDGNDYAHRLKTIAALDAGAGHGQAVEQLTGEHREVALIINMVPGTTFDRDEFAHKHHNNIQAFNYDFWVSQHIAPELFPSEEKQQEFLTVRAMLALATAMTLTDGTIKLMVRKEA
jgi:hypothetical protein